MSPEEAEKKITTCIEDRSLAHADPHHDIPEGLAPPKIVSTVMPHFPAAARELQVQGISHVHFTVSEHGVPVGFQIVQAVGAGMDEETLRTVSAYQFEPARRNEKAVPADLDVKVNYSTSP